MPRASRRACRDDPVLVTKYYPVVVCRTCASAKWLNVGLSMVSSFEVKPRQTSYDEPFRPRFPEFLVSCRRASTGIWAAGCEQRQLHL